MNKIIILLSFSILTLINVNAQNIRFTEMVGKPTNSSATIQLFFSDSAEMQIQYGTVSGIYPNQTPWASFSANLPAEITINGLQPDTKYYYRVRHRVPGTNTPTSRAEHFFHTQRNTGSTFSFVVEADPHSDEQSDSTLYAQCLQNQLSDNPDFMIDLGDFLMTDKLKNRSTNLIPRDTITYRCNVFRSFYQISSHSVPLFIALGNHEGEAGWNRVGNRIDSSNNIAIWDVIDRKKYFMNPAPDAFYSGDTSHQAFVGQRENYYSWTWGDALFIVLDPYWYTSTKPDSLHGWRWTLGKTQYDWMKKTLEDNDSKKFKFVFAHQIIGGDPDGRGGVEFADRYEWGGKSLNGEDSFAFYRPGWYKPIKDLLKEHKVNIFFHGHDHFYGKQEKDCLVYQETPQPSHPNPSNSDVVNYADDYGYHEGIIQASSGHMRVTVAPAGVTVDYVRTYLPANEDATHHNKDVSATYFISSSNNCYDSTSPPPVNDSLTLVSNVTPTLYNCNYDIRDNIYPNPFSDQTKIEFEIKNAENLHFLIHNDLGQLVRRWDYNNSVPLGKYLIVWDGKNAAGTKLPSGTYFYSIRGDNGVIKSGKIVLVR